MIFWKGHHSIFFSLHSLDYNEYVYISFSSLIVLFTKRLIPGQEYSKTLLTYLSIVHHFVLISRVMVTFFVLVKSGANCIILDLMCLQPKHVSILVLVSDIKSSL